MDRYLDSTNLSNFILRMSRPTLKQANNLNSSDDGKYNFQAINKNLFLCNNTVYKFMLEIITSKDLYKKIIIKNYMFQWNVYICLPGKNS